MAAPLRDWPKATETVCVTCGSRLCGNAIELSIIARLGACFARCYQIEINRFLRSNLMFLMPPKAVQIDRKKGHLALNGQYPDRSHEFLNAENVDDSSQVIGQHLQTHLRTDMFTGLHQEVR